MESRNPLQPCAALTPLPLPDTDLTHLMSLESLFHADFPTPCLLASPTPTLPNPGTESHATTLQGLPPAATVQAASNPTRLHDLYPQHGSVTLRHSRKLQSERSSGDSTLIKDPVVLQSSRALLAIPTHVTPPPAAMLAAPIGQGCNIVLPIAGGSAAVKHAMHHAAKPEQHAVASQSLIGPLNGLKAATQAARAVAPGVIKTSAEASTVAAATPQMFTDIQQELLLNARFTDMHHIGTPGQGGPGHVVPSMPQSANELRQVLQQVEQQAQQEVRAAQVRCKKRKRRVLQRFGRQLLRQAEQARAHIHKLDNQMARAAKEGGTWLHALHQ